MGINIIDLGVLPYEEALRVQERILEQRLAGRCGDTILLLEHPDVLTMGRAASPEDIRNKAFFLERDVRVVHTCRGGGVTYHSPGQLLIYPIVCLDPPMRDVSGFLDLLETITAAALSELGILACRDKSKRGVWVSGKKIAFTGVKFKRWVSSHGVAVNINNDILPFRMIDPCGDASIEVTSANLITGAELDMTKVKEIFAGCFSSGLKWGAADAFKAV
jgi:lipoate-protein ligase B